MHYLDYAATTPVPRAVAKAMAEALTESFGNPSSQYSLGRQARDRLERDRRVIAGALGCKPEQLFFTSCGTEGDNWAIRAALHQNRRVGRHIVTTAVEHSAVLQCLKALEREGYSVTYLKPDGQGRIAASQVAEALREDTALVSVMLVNNETGARFPVEEIAALLHDRPALLHTDAVQAFLKVPFTPAELGADLLTVSGHKVRAPKGVGALYIRKGLKLKPLLLGGGQERSLRPGTEPTAQIAALAAACAAWLPHREAYAAHMRAVKDRFLALAEERLSGAVVLSRGDAHHICALSLPGYPSEMLVRELGDRGICVSSGSACHRGKPSHVFAATGRPKRELMGALRVSFSPDSTAEEAEALVSALEEIRRARIPAGR